MRTLILLLLLACAGPAWAEPEAALPSPRSSTTSGPEELITLAEAGNMMAQFILGDIYSKGKAGVERHDGIARGWFTRAAHQGEPFAMIRLAALSKKQEKWEESYKWYTLALARIEDATATAFLEEQRTMIAENLDEDGVKAAKKQARKWRDAGMDEPEKKKTIRTHAVYEFNR